jgi:hypothetical protein
MDRRDKIMLATTFAVLAVLGIIAHYWDHYENKHPESLLGPPAYVAGPNAESDECKKLRDRWLPIIDAEVNSESVNDDQETREFERIMRSPMTEAQRETALQRLFARQDISATALEAKFREADTNLRDQELEAGCLVLNH